MLFHYRFVVSVQTITRFRSLTRSFRYDGPPGEELVGSILRSPLQLILGSSKDRESMEKLTSDMYHRLELSSPARLKQHYSDIVEQESPFKPYASLVAEETRHSIASALDKLFCEKTKKIANNQNGVLVRFTEERKEPYNGRPALLEFWTKRPLNNNDRNKLKAGTIVALKTRRKRDSQDTVLAMIQYGSLSSSICKFEYFLCFFH
mmetsp:Transcript_12779/g.18797  ORF Transcript_12779/g.18797 Transcript_12779/m.18797 type:complete len:206 (-) Transcript_12779:516-1133(-)